MTVAKASGNGFPPGAVGAAVLDLLDEERVMERAVRAGTRFTELMQELQARHVWIGAVHGSGLYHGVELVRDREPLEPTTEETALVCERMLHHGIIVQPASERQNVLKSKPPTSITEFDVEAFAQALDVELARLG
ncbi:aminotransferase class III-fold pyridoxal phosphate-dependent enzyme [Gulosibacter sediminis]|uniref:aminotransferase class III-fold pyridoxal phosphate-dependent enzyme n=1 Tax=Gulosibacter sediminis TaxID=1729695 RepID=UPI0024A7BC63|nr:aminotransferase class III-fold pyridoxal phosphate-dependent enzyme [Gulosibacter sediminis]